MARRKRGQNGRPWLRKLPNGVLRWYLPKGATGGKLVPVRRTDGSFIDGESGEQEAMQVWHGLMSMQDAPTAGDANPLAVVLELFLQHKRDEKAAPKTLNEYKKYFQGFIERWPGLTVGELRSFHLQRWFQEHRTWGPTYRSLIGETFKAALNWAEGADGGNIITKNPLRGMKLPRKRSRGAETLIAEEDYKRLLAIIPSENLRNVLIALWETGARPNSICRAEARNLDRKQKVLLYGDWNTDPDSPPHKTFKVTGRPLVVHLTPTVFDMCCRLADEYPSGPLFRTVRGKKWTAANLASQVRDYADKLGLEDIIPYGCRHTLATDLLERGEPDAEVAAIMGHTNTDMIYRHYGHLGARIQRRRETLMRNRPPMGGGSESLPPKAETGDDDGPAA